MKRRLIIPSIVIYPASYNRVEHVSQVFKGLVGHSVQSPAPDGIAYGFGGLIAHGWKETHKKFAIPGFRPAKAKRVTQKIKFLVWILSPFGWLPAKDNFGLARI